MTELTTYEAFILASGALILGIIMLVRGGDQTIDASVYVADRFGVSPLVVGFTILAFGTSLPELVISVFANLQGSSGIAIGNVIGSNIANILLVLAVTALFVPMKITVSKNMLKDVGFMVFCSVLMTCILVFSGGVTRLAGFSMVALLGLYVFLQYQASKKESKVQDEEMTVPQFSKPSEAYGFLFFGLVLIALGAEFLVQGARVSAGLLGIPESVIALSIVALGTSLPELSTSIIAGRKGQYDMVVGNIIGSNVFNILMIIGVTSIIKPIPVGGFDAQLINFDVWVMLLVASIFTCVLVLSKKISRMTGGLFLFSYVAYTAYIYAVNLLQ
ncbi:MAG: calcium/sodium antiporter [Alphaproteobacteria bacterium]|nr:calcium/sodium antiporter [Alphaproteobacteria bacterium]